MADSSCSSLAQRGHVVVGRQPGRGDEDLVLILPVVAGEAHLLGDLGDHPPVGFGLTRRVHEAVGEAQAPLAVPAVARHLAPAGRRQHQIGAAGGEVGEDVLGEEEHPVVVDALDEVGDDLVGVQRLRTGHHRLLAEDRLARPLRRVGHPQRVGADDVVDLDLAVGHVLVDVVGDLVPFVGIGGQIERVVGAAGVPLLMPTGAGDAAPRLADRAGQERQVAERADRLVVDAPGGALLKGQQRLARRAVVVWLGRSARWRARSSRPGRR